MMTHPCETAGPIVNLLCRLLHDWFSPFPAHGNFDVHLTVSVDLCLWWQCGTVGALRTWCSHSVACCCCRCRCVAVCAVAAPVFNLLPAVSALPVLGGVPLAASWAPTLCTCVYNRCEYLVQVVQSLDGANSTVVAPTSNGNATTYSTTSLPLVDAAVLTVQVQCVDVFNRTTPWLPSLGTTVVVGSRALSIPSTVPASAGTRGFINAFQPSTAPLRCLVSVWPPLVYNITVQVTRTYLPSNAPDTMQPSDNAWVGAGVDGC